MMRLLDGGALAAADIASRLRRPRDSVLARLQFLQNVFGAAVCRGGVWRLSFSPEWLDGGRLAAALPGAEVAEETPGTNLLAKTRARGALIFAEHQTRGRGRRGRRWLAMPGGSILASARLPAPPVLPGLSLAVGAALWRAFGGGLRLKWPNDLWNCKGEKVGGVLIETAGGDVIIGAGINLVMTPRLRAQIARPAAGLESPPPRNECAERAGEAIRRAAAAFHRGGLSGFLADAHEAHYFRPGAEISLSFDGGGAVRGEFAGFSEEGALLVRGGGGVQSYFSGELAHVACG
ncbi:MAG: biotin--[acetyl-CoA-carboxylase] ligase [Betaproteobacteria bacterium]|nr:biotin--[acetyl-CoA-carboxylase] ligase [Betaproteobacteria bacterium]